jgi:hypothetical protein
MCLGLAWVLAERQCSWCQLYHRERSEEHGSIRATLYDQYRESSGYRCSSVQLFGIVPRVMQSWCGKGAEAEG